MHRLLMTPPLIHLDYISMFKECRAKSGLRPSQKPTDFGRREPRVGLFSFLRLHNPCTPSYVLVADPPALLCLSEPDTPFPTLKQKVYGSFNKPMPVKETIAFPHSSRSYHDFSTSKYHGLSSPHHILYTKTHDNTIPQITMHIIAKTGKFLCYRYIQRREQSTNLPLAER